MQQLTILLTEVVTWGEGVLGGRLAALSAEGLERPFVMSVAFLDAMRAEQVTPHLADAVGAFTDLPAHAPDHAIDAALEAAIAAGAGSILAHGGGSVLDAAKAVSYRHHERTGRFLPIAALPTTLSGSEFSHYFGITETGGATRFKRSYAVRETAPRWIILDPVLIADTPRDLLLSSAVKGIDHAVEGMRKVAVSHPHAIMAATGVRWFLDALERWPGDKGPRDALAVGQLRPADLLRMQLAAWYCYFAPASVIYGLSHRIGHILGGTYEAPHSMTSGVTLAPVIREAVMLYGDKLAPFVDGPAEDAAARLADRIDAAVTRVGLPRRIGDLGVDRAHLQDVATMLRREYPNEVADLGPGADARLEAMLESMW